MTLIPVPPEVDSSVGPNATLPLQDPMSEQDDILREFLEESFEGLDQVEGELVALESNPDDVETLSSIFRTIHSIKGASGFLELVRLERIAHAGENLLDALRSRRCEMNDVVATALLEMSDAVRGMLRSLESTGSEGASESHEGLVQRLTELLESASETETETETVRAAAPVESSAAESGDPPAPRADVDKAGETRREATQSVADSSIRIRVDQLDALMNLAGELVLARNQILQHTARLEDVATNASAQRLSLITSELQEGIMKVRMQPVGLLWNKLPRIVRDLSLQLGKEVDVSMEGAETELDKTLLEAIKDPLTHVVRNSLDHGVEPPDERAAKGKPRRASLRLSAGHESGQVKIVIEDDGRGVDIEAVRAKAVERGVVTQEDAARMDDRAALDLLFAPGLSTAAAVTNVSGRGVGMDVVRSNLERVGGTVELETERGRGTRVQIRIPLTLAIIPALTVLAGGQRYAIPQASLVELVRVEAGEEGQIERIQGQPVYRLRGRLLPLVDLGEQLAVDAQRVDAGCSIVVVQAAGRRFGLVVDEIHETEEIVVKPLDRQVKGLDVYAGTTILGDGRVALILDVSGLANRSSLGDERLQSTAVEESSAEADRASDRSHLVFMASGDRRMALDLRSVDRLEEIDASIVERAGTARVIQYRGGILPLVDVGQVLGGAVAEPGADGLLRVIVRSDEFGSFGLVVDEVQDIVELEPDAPRHPSQDSGVHEIVVADGCVTELLDVDWLLERCRGAGPANAGAPECEAGPAQEGATVSQLCTFRLGDSLFGVDVLEVQEVLRPQDRTPIPLASPEIEGLINLRGDTVLLIDMRRRLGLPPLERAADFDLEHDTAMNVVLRTQEGVVSILVDEVGEVLELSCNDFEPCPESLDSGTREIARGVFKLEEELLLLLDVASIARVSESAALAGA